MPGTLLLILGTWCMVSLAGGARTALGSEPPWPSPVAGWEPVEPGEHPRLFFRQSDLPELRRRAQSEEGRMIVQRCRRLLGIDGHPETPYTLWDGAALGFLYQITGEQRYADLGREAVERAFEGERDRDDRYAWVEPRGPMRAGPSMAAIAMAYDLCYDGWDENFRRGVARAIMDYDQPTHRGRVTLERLAINPHNPNPVSNHFALQVGGAGLAILAIMGDEGADDERLARYMAGVHRNARKVMGEDFGEAGYFHEHPGPGVIASTWTFIPWLQAERIAAGRDWISPRPHGEWITLRFAHQVVPDEAGPFYMNPSWGRVSRRVGYGSDYLHQAGGHHGAYFCQGFGAIQARHRPALLWVYENFVEPTEQQRYPDLLDEDERSFDVFTYPHRALFALVNWPFDEKPRNPAEVLPRVSADPTMGQYVFRNRWRDGDDTVVAVLFGARTRFGDEATRNRIMIRSLGMRLSVGRLVGRDGIASQHTAAADGSGVATAGDNAIAVDFSGAAGVDAVVIIAGPAATGELRGDVAPERVKLTELELDGLPINVLTFAPEAEHPTPRIEGGRIRVGGQSFQHDGRGLIIGQFER